MLCRRAWQRLGPLARGAVRPSPTTVAPARHMSFGIPGGSSNMTYFVLCGGGLTAAVVYAYKTVSSDSERYDDRLGNMGSKTKAAPPAKVAPEAIAAESSPEVEAAPATEVLAEPISALAETEPVVEDTVEAVAAAALAEVVTVTAAEPAVTGEAPTPVAVEADTEAAPVVEEVAVEEASAAAPAAESAESVSHISTAAKILAASTVEIAAASVGETSIVKAVRQMEGDDKAPGAVGPTVGGRQPEVLEAAKEEEAKAVAEEAVAEEAVAEEAALPEANEAFAVVKEEGPDSAGAPAVAVDPPTEEVTDTNDAEAPIAEQVITEKTPAPPAEDEEKEAAALLSEDATVAVPAVEAAGEAEVGAGAQDPVPEADPEGATSSVEVSPEESAPTEKGLPVEEVAAEEAALTEEAAPEEEVAPAENSPDAEASVEEVAVEAPAEPAAEVAEAAPTHDEAAPDVDMNQLATGSAGSDLEVLPAAEPEPTSEAPVMEADHCPACHSAPSAEEEGAPPAASGVQVEVQVASEGSMDIAEQEAKEAVSLVDGPPTETMAVVAAQA